MVTFRDKDDLRSFTTKIMEGLRSIDGVKQVAKEKGGGDEIIIDWQNHDPDPRFESAMSVDFNRGRMNEMTLRFGPVATYDMFPKDRRQDLEAEWVDVVLNSTMATRPRLDIDARDIDLGDMYISEYARPHLRVTRKPEGYETSADKIVEFLRELNQRHKRKFGTLEDRLMDPKYDDILEMR